jgi:hypothetical protein
LSATYSSLQANIGSAPPGFAGGSWGYYDVTLSETSGNTGITVNNRQRCYDSSSFGVYCDDIKTDISSKFGTNYISQSGNIISNNRWVFTSASTLVVTETFSGTDDNGNSVSDSYSFTVNN